MMKFHPVFLSSVIIGVGILLTILFVWFESRRAIRFRALRMLAVVVMMGALCLLLLRPHSVDEGREGLFLLTPGYSKESVDSLLSTNPGVGLFHIPDATPYRESSLLPSVQELERLMYPVVAIAGEGLPSYDLELLKNQFIYLPPSLPEGIVDIQIPTHITRNSQSSLSGVYYSKDSNTRLYLESPSGKEDSVLLTGPGVHPFTLSFLPRTEGRILYSLTTDDTAASPLRERIPVDVEHQRPLNILIVQGFPTFEVQYLKNFLASRQHRIAVRYQLSKNIFRTEFANRTAVPLTRLDRGLLNSTDLLVLDEKIATSLSASERSMIEQALRNGLGVLLLVSGEGKAIPAPFVAAPMTKVARDTATVLISEKKTALPVAPLRVRNGASLETITKNNSDIFSGYQNRYNGRIGFQLLKETYRLKLSGDSIRYSLLWTPLIEKTSRRNVDASTLSVKTPLPVYPDEPLRVELLSELKNPILQFDSITVPLKEDVLLDNVWETSIWANEAGWHGLISDSDTVSAFVFRPGEWSALRISRQIKETTRRSKGLPAISGSSALIETEIPPVYFFVAFLVVAGFLWLAPKL